MKPVLKTLTCFFLITGLGLGLCADIALAKAPSKSVAVLPLSVNADKDIGYLCQGINRMLHSRLTWRDRVLVLPSGEIEKLVTDGTSLSGDQQVRRIAKETGSDYVIQGSITKLAGSFSIDTKVFDIGNSQYMAFFEQSDNEDELISKVDRIAALINKKVFDRETVTWNEIEKEKQALIEKQKRQNPELMMTLPPGWKKKENHGWKVWKYLF